MASTTPLANKVAANLPTVAAVNKLITGSLPFTNGPYYYPNTGINSVIFPDFSKANTASTTTPTTTNPSTDITPVYYPAAELVNVYAAYNSHNPSSLDYEYNSTPDPIANKTPELGIDFTEANGNTGFWQVLTNLYATMVYGPSAATQTEIAKASNKINVDFQAIADKWQADFMSYKATGPQGIPGKTIAPLMFGIGDGSVKASDTYAGVKKSLNFTISLALKDPAIGLKPTSKQYQDWISNQDKSTLKSDIYSGISTGLFDWDKTFTGFWPGTNCNAACQLTGEPSNNTLPITSEMYAKFADIVVSGDSIIKDDLKNIAALQKLELETAESYLKDLQSYNEGEAGADIPTTPKSEYASIEPGLSGIPAGTIVPNYPELTPPSPSGSTIEFSIST